MRSLIDARTWPVKNAKRILDRIKQYETKNEIILGSGFGPSGLPHLGTISELVRTRMLQYTLQNIQNKPVKIISYCDDLDGLRKVPENVPNQHILEKNIGKPVSNIPDPFGCCESFAAHNIRKLHELIEQFDLTEHVKVIPVSTLYKSGAYNNEMLVILQKYQKVLDIILPILGKERKATYSPFLPISPISGKVLTTGVISHNLTKKTITVKESNEVYDVSIFDGCCKLQWKIDYGMRWAAQKIDYEMYGKDLISSAEIGSQICELLGEKAPVQMYYEMFLDGSGKKISKSKGNGIDLFQWLRYAPIHALKHFLYFNPDRAKMLNMDDLPKYIDTYYSALKKYSLKNEDHVENALFYVHEKDVPQKIECSYTLLVNLAESVQSPNLNTFQNFVLQRLPDLNLQLIEKAFTFYQEQYKINERIKVSQWMIKYLQEFLAYMVNHSTADEMQTKLYDLGNIAVQAKEVENLKKWFENLYLVLFGRVSGPRLGNFFALYGINNSIKMINKTLEQ